MNGRELLTVDIQLFAGAAELAGARRVQLSLPAGSRLELVRRSLASQHPNLANLLELSRWAVGTEFVDDDFTLTEPQVMVLIPPVSGG